jgi:DMSO/TMAO reductase YedYZ molybdopterin-dependent catalytic subunit
MVARPLVLDLAALRAQPQRTVEVTMECSGNHGLPFFTGGIGTARWGGVQLRRLLRAAAPRAGADEVVFWGADRGPVTISDNPGITGGGRSGTTAPDAGGGLDLTVTERFARSMSVEEALNPANLLCWEMDGGPLPPEHGAPVRLIAPGWYGVANVKWLTRIEVRDQRFAGRFMARDYVTIREEAADGGPLWTASTVGRDRLKSAPAKVTRRDGRYAVLGAAWGAEVAAVQVQVDDGPWRAARLHRGRRSRASREFAWTLWTFPWGRPAPGEHRIRSRAVDVRGEVQPAPDDPFLTAKVTYWESNGQITRRVLIPG